VKGFLALLVLVGSTVRAQDVATIGSFVDPDGKPIANATVTFATSPPDVFGLFAPPHVVEATTDAAGKFKVKLRQGAAHSAWARTWSSCGPSRRSDHLLDRRRRV
jgi:hypothetical protein